MLEVRLEGLTLRVANVKRSIEFYGGKLGLRAEIDKAPQFAMIRVGGPTGGTIVCVLQLGSARIDRLLDVLQGRSSITESEEAACHACIGLPPIVAAIY